MITVGDVIKINAIEIDSLGNAVAKHQGLVIFVKGLIDGETALVKIVKLKKNHAIAIVEKMLTTSEKRRSEKHELGAMDMYHLNDEAQLSWQKQITQSSLTKVGLNTEVYDTLYAGKSLYYRNKGVFHANNNDGNLVLSLYDEHTKKLINPTNYLLVDVDILNLFNMINEWQIKVDDKVKHLVFRANEKGQMLITIVALNKEFKGKQRLVDFLSSFEFVTGIMLNIKTNPRHILNGKSIVLYGKNSLCFAFGSINISVGDCSFFQVNTPVAKQVCNLISDFVSGDSVVDAYAGVATIGLSIANKASKVICIESNEENIYFAEKNIVQNKANNVAIIPGFVEDNLANIDADCLIVDPPRSGLHSALIDVITTKRYKKIAYLSCDLNTLIRDLNKLSSIYKIIKVIPVKMFFQTSAIETLVFLKIK